MQAIIDDRYFKNTAVISPGKVGSVGDVLGSVRLKQSAPDMPLRYDQVFSGKNEPTLGSNVQDGYSYSYTSGGGPARTLDASWENESFKIQHGWRFQDLRAPDKTVSEIMGSTGRYDWYNRLANTYQAKITGDMFLPLPGPYEPTGVPRGGQVPRVIAVDEPVAPPLTNEDWDKTKEKNKTPMVSIICTDANGTRTYKLVPGKMPTSGKTPPTTSTSQPTASTKPQAANQASNTQPANQPELDIRMM